MSGLVKRTHQLTRERLHIRPPLLTVRIERAHDRRVHLVRDIKTQRTRRRRRLHPTRGTQPIHLMRRPPSQRRIGNSPQRVLIRTLVEPLTHRLLRRDVRRSTAGHGDSRHFVEGLAQPEIGQDRPLPLVRTTEQNVRGFHVTVQQPPPVQRLQPTPDLDDHPDRRNDRQRLLLQPVRERAAVGVREHQERPPVLQFAHVVDLDDMLGLDPAQEPALLEEPAPDRVVVSPVVGQHLDRHFGVKLLVVSEPYRSETARAQAAAHDVPA